MASSQPAGSQPSSSQALPPLQANPSSSFGEYRSGFSPQECLGRGEYGAVYACQRRSDEKPFAVKVINLRRQLPDRTNRQLELLTREADILTDLSRKHANIVRCEDMVIQDSWLFFVFEMMQGSLLDVVEELDRPFHPLEACYVLRQLVEGLRFLHSRRVIHRDLKMENILIARRRKEGQIVYLDVKIADFGLSKILDGKLGQTCSSVGSLQYVAPEVLQAVAGATPYGLEADIWSLGILFYVMLRGTFPPKRDLDGAIDILPEEYNCRDMARSMLKHSPDDRVSLERLGSWLGRQSEDEQVREQAARRRQREEQDAEPVRRVAARQREEQNAGQAPLEQPRRDEEIARRLAQEEKDKQVAFEFAMQEAMEAKEQEQEEQMRRRRRE